jgi:hypothetical protein
MTRATCPACHRSRPIQDGRIVQHDTHITKRQGGAKITRSRRCPGSGQAPAGGGK